MNMQDILIRPVLTEKSMAGTAKDRYAFIVARKATKPQIKSAVESLFGVEVLKVHTMIMKGGIRRITGRKLTITSVSDSKKALIQIKPGKTIDIFDFSGGDKKESKKSEKKSETVLDRKKAEKKSLTERLHMRQRKG